MDVIASIRAGKDVHFSQKGEYDPPLRFYAYGDIFVPRDGFRGRLPLKMPLILLFGEGASASSASPEKPESEGLDRIALS